MTSVEPLFIRKKNSETSFTKVVGKIHEILLQTSAHGIPRLLRTKSIVFKVLWTIIIIGSAIFGSYFTINTILSYLKYETTTSVSIVSNNQAEFPSMTLCSIPSFNSTLNNTIVNFLFFQKVYNVEDYFEFFEDPLYKTCIRFNTGKYLPVLKSIQNGLTFGLMIDINFEKLDGYDNAFVLVMFHNKSSPPLDLLSGSIWLTTGTSNIFKIDRVFYENLGQPYSNCLKDVNNFKYNKTLINLILSLNISYSQKECLKLCSYMFTLEKSNCNCKSTILKFQGDCIYKWFDYDFESQILNCTYNYLKKFVDEDLHTECDEYCPLECESSQFLITSNNLIFSMSGNIGNKTSKATSLNRYNTYENIKKQIVRIYAHYDDFRYNLITQSPKTELFNCISNVGGIFSLFLGISLISVFEIFEIIFDVINVLISK